MKDLLDTDEKLKNTARMSDEPVELSSPPGYYWEANESLRPRWGTSVVCVKMVTKHY